MRAGHLDLELAHSAGLFRHQPVVYRAQRRQRLARFRLRSCVSRAWSSVFIVIPPLVVDRKESGDAGHQQRIIVLVTDHHEVPARPLEFEAEPAVKLDGRRVVGADREFDP